MEIERKYLVAKENLPKDLHRHPHLEIEQAYLSNDPVVRIRKQDDSYYLTYKSKGLMVREEYNLPLTEQAYLHLREKADGIVLTKTRYQIPLLQKLTAELDVFHGKYQGLFLVEVEFESEKAAESFTPPDWFGEDVTFSSRYHNSTLAYI
ncbi:MAG: CYTH domain-containing protein [Lachnospiraceae bacterium]|nr:CYTH domain-containing protein [Lachnospiraceae bacterium]